MKRARILISGFVQGVGYRHFVRKNALELGLTGWIRNLPGTGVEAVFESLASSDQVAKEKIEDMISLCRKGPFMSEVKNMEVKWEEGTDEFNDFEIVM
ncbi:MAG: acylphosphatase [Candidatus Levyibacteriota bacterium]